MRILFLLLLATGLHAQNGFTWYNVPGGEFKIGVKWPPDTSSGTKYATFFFTGGNGQQGTDVNLMYQVGVGRQFTLPVASQMPTDIIYVLILPTNIGFTEQPNRMYGVFDYFLSKTGKSDTTRWGYGGLSQGGQNVFSLRGWSGDASLSDFGTGANYRMNRFCLFVEASTPKMRDLTIYSRFAGTRFRLFHGSADAAPTQPFWTDQLYSDLIAAGAFGTKTIVAGAAHGNDTWDVTFGPTGTDTSNNIYLALKAGRTGNITPTANAGSNQTLLLPTNTGVLDGRGSADADGTISAYLWTKLSGGPATIVSATSASTTATGLTAGVYVFNLRVTDNVGATNDATVTITVKANGTKYTTAPLSGDITITKNSTTPPLSGRDTLVVVGTTPTSITSIQIQDIQGTEILISGYGVTMSNAFPGSLKQPKWNNLDGVTIAGFTWLNWYGTIGVENAVYNTKLKDLTFKNTTTFMNQPVMQWDKPFSTDMVFTGSKSQTFYNDTLERCTFQGYKDITPLVFGTNWNTSNNEINRSIMLDLVLRYDTFKNITNTSSGFNVVSGTGFGLKYYGNFVDSISANTGAFQNNHTAALLWYGSLKAYDNLSSNMYASAIRNYALRWTGLPGYSNDSTLIVNNKRRRGFSYSDNELSGTGAGNRNSTYGFQPIAYAAVVHNISDSTTANSYNYSGVGNGYRYHGKIVDLTNMGAVPILIEGNAIFRPEMDYTYDSSGQNNYIYSEIGSAATNKTVRNNFNRRYSTGFVVDSINYKPAASSPMIGTVNLIPYASQDHFGVTRTSGNVSKGWSVYTPGASPPACTNNTSPANGSTVAGQTTATLIWTAASGATNYDVYLNGSLLVNRTVTNYTVTGLTPSTNYSWYVVPKSSAGAASGCVSNSTTFTTAAIPVPACAVNLMPVNGSTVTGQTTASLMWSSVSGATGYKVFIGTDQIADINTTSYTAATLQPNTIYQYHIRPYNSSGTAIGCNVSAVTTFTTALGKDWLKLDIKRKQ